MEKTIYNVPGGYSVILPWFAVLYEVFIPCSRGNICPGLVICAVSFFTRLNMTVLIGYWH